MKKLLPLLIIAVLLVSGCIGQDIKEDHTEVQNKSIETGSIDTTDPRSQYYDNLDEALEELELIESAEE